jgi:hypothetical protein
MNTTTEHAYKRLTNQLTYKTSNRDEVSRDIVEGTCGQGEVISSLQELTDLFGPPHAGDGYKVDAEWDILFEDGVIATVYNWKNGPNYLGEGEADLKYVDCWNVGGNDECVETRIEKILADHRSNK